MRLLRPVDEQLVCPACGVVLMVDLRCRSGHSTLRTQPQLVRGVRRAGGRWADLRLP